MTQTRIRIDLTQGMFEAEGTEEFVRSIYADFKQQIQQTPVKRKAQVKKTKQTQPTMQTKELSKQRKAGPSKAPPKIVNPKSSRKVSISLPVGRGSLGTRSGEIRQMPVCVS